MVGWRGGEKKDTCPIEKTILRMNRTKGSVRKQQHFTKRKKLISSRRNGDQGSGPRVIRPVKSGVLANPGA